MSVRRVGYMSMACVYPHLEYKRSRLSRRMPSCTFGLFAMSAREPTGDPAQRAAVCQANVS